MISPPASVAADVAAAVEAYDAHADAGTLIRSLQDISQRADPDALINATAPYLERPEVAGPLYERIVELRPNDARALVTLANAYWLHGRGGEVVGDLAARAIASDPTNRGAWHLWALSESDIRARVARWQQVTTRYPDDDLAKAILADNATSLAGAESDEHALALAIVLYEDLLSRATMLEQREALEKALMTLKSWAL
jgi:hypothetical protein